MEATIRRFQCNYLGHVLRMSETRYPRIMLHAEIDLGKRKSGGQELTYRACARKNLDLFSINGSKGFVALQHLAQNRAVWRKVVRDGSQIFMDKWLSKELKLSYERFLPGFLVAYDYVLGPPSDDVIEDAYRRAKYGDFWRIEEAEANITVRKGVRSANQLLHKKHVKKYKVIVEEQSRVSRLLEDMRK